MERGCAPFTRDIEAGRMKMSPELARLMTIHAFGSRYGWPPEVTENLDATDADALLAIIEKEKRFKDGKS